MDTLIIFEEGKSYATPSIVDSSYMVTVTIVKRTAKRVTFIMKDESKPITKGIGIYEGKEFFYPQGQYSMCPIIRADDLIEDEKETAEIADSDIVLFSNGETLADLFREGADLFTSEQMAAIKASLVESLSAPRPTAKIYNMADYRR